jgi:CheY-like chemotaxis protein
MAYDLLYDGASDSGQYMPKILVADDVDGDRSLIVKLFKKRPFSDVIAVGTGEEALGLLGDGPADVLLAGSSLPDLDAETLFERARELQPALPIIFLTRERPDESMVKALHLGAASYVPRSQIARSVEDTVERVLSLCEKSVIGTRLLDTMTASSMAFELPGDPSLFSDVIHYLLEQMDHFGLLGSLDRISVGVAIQEALLNAWIHGNLEIDSSRKKDGFFAYDRLVQERKERAPYRDRKVTVRSSFDASVGRIEIEDEGKGFDVSTVPDPRLPENVKRPSGRGLFLMRQFFDEVSYNDVGNKVTLVKHRLS